MHKSNIRRAGLISIWMVLHGLPSGKSTFVPVSDTLSDCYFGNQSHLIACLRPLNLKTKDKVKQICYVTRSLYITAENQGKAGRGAAS